VRRFLPAAVIAVFLGCSRSTLAPAADLTGVWLALGVESSTTLTLVQVGDSVAGSGAYFRFINPPTGAFTVTGTYARPLVSLTFRYDTGVTTHFAGVAQDPTHFAGMETSSGGATDSLSFEKQ